MLIRVYIVMIILESYLLLNNKIVFMLNLWFKSFIFRYFFYKNFYMWLRGYMYDGVYSKFVFEKK